MNPVKVLVVDPAAMPRRVVIAALAPRTEIKVIGEAGDARTALELCARHAPEVVTVDLSAEQEGLQMVQILKRAYPLMQVICFTATSERGASATLKALALGAVDFVTRPAVGASGETAVRRLAAELTDKVLAAGKRRRGITANLMIAELQKSPERPPQPSTGKIDVVAIAASTGGPMAVSQVLSALPAEFPAPVLVVLHMPATFSKIFATQLQAKTRLKVKEGASFAVARHIVGWAPSFSMMIVGKSSLRFRNRKRYDTPALRSIASGFA